MPDRHGGSTRFRSATNINHSRTQPPASGIPRNPGRPQGRRDTMPRNRGDSPQKTGIPAWAKAFMQKQGTPDWAKREAQKHRTGYAPPPEGTMQIHPYPYSEEGMRGVPTQPSPQPEEGTMQIHPYPYSEEGMRGVPTQSEEGTVRDHRVRPGDPYSEEGIVGGFAPRTPDYVEMPAISPERQDHAQTTADLRKRLAMFRGLRR